jgi:hypothetical protein
MPLPCYTLLCITRVGGGRQPQAHGVDEEIQQTQAMQARITYRLGWRNSKQWPCLMNALRSCHCRSLTPIDGKAAEPLQ